MSATATTEVVGVKNAIKSLRKIDTELRKQFTRDAKEIARPIITEAQNAYPRDLLSGMARSWTQRGGQKFPYTQNKARSGVKFKVDARAKGGAAIKVQQKDPAAAIADIAGRRTANRLSQPLDRFGRPSRFMWPAAERRLPAVTKEMEAAVLEVVRLTNRELG